jgi:hypothetical protein
MFKNPQSLIDGQDRLYRAKRDSERGLSLTDVIGVLSAHVSANYALACKNPNVKTYSESMMQTVNAQCVIEVAYVDAPTDGEQLPMVTFLCYPEVVASAEAYRDEHTRLIEEVVGSWGVIEVSRLPVVNPETFWFARFDYVNGWQNVL